MAHGSHRHTYIHDTHIHTYTPTYMHCTYTIHALWVSLYTLTTITRKICKKQQNTSIGMSIKYKENRNYQTNSAHGRVKLGLSKFCIKIKIN